MRSAWRRAVAALLWTVCACVVAPARAQERFYIEGLVDGEAWNADGDRFGVNGGDPMALGRVHLWAAVDPTPKLSLFALGVAEHGFGEEGRTTRTELEQGFVRFSTGSLRPVSLEAGRIAPPMGEFARRHLSNVNPLVGTPGGAYVEYPVGIRVAGAVARFDYQAAILDTPSVWTPWTPEPDRAFRPLIGVGVTPFTGLRLGLVMSRGPYLNQDLADAIPADRDWRDFNQDAISLEVDFSHGYLEMHGEFLLTEYDIPFASSRLEARGSYLEAKYTWSPRWFSAIRIARTRYPYVWPLGPTRWLDTTAAVADAEVGLGYRLGPATILKASFRTERWDESALQHGHVNGSALAVQISHQFDVKSWFRRSAR